MSTRVSASSAVPAPFNTLINPLLTDYYQVSMVYAYWKAGKQNVPSVFDLFFRKCPFKGEFAIFAGLSDCIRFIANFAFSKDDIEYLKVAMKIPESDADFLDYLAQLSTSEVKVYSLKEGTVAFPRIPLLRVEGPLAVVQLLETTLLNLVNFASLVATNAARFRLAAGPEAKLLEFGLRRAQGPDGAMTASRFCYMGGFNATSNVLAGKLYDIPIAGTHAHSFVSSFQSADEVADKTLAYKGDPSKSVVFFDLVLEKQELLQSKWKEGPGKKSLHTDQRELAAFTAFALAFPDGFLALIDTYDVFQSGAPNFIIVALALHDLGYTPRGIRLDSGDLAYQSVVVRSYFDHFAEELNMGWLKDCAIVASNDINEATLISLRGQSHAITTFGVGTHLVTCQAQPALGAVFKLVTVDEKPCMKLSAERKKVTIPGKKVAYRLYGSDESPICDVMLLEDEEPPQVGVPFLCHHPFQAQKRAMVNPTKVECLHDLAWEGTTGVSDPLPTLNEKKAFAQAQLSSLRPDIVRFLNPTPYKVSVSKKLYDFHQEMWLQNAPVGELS